jgi:diguanylate cyclase (GGDEF)-like protein
MAFLSRIGGAQQALDLLGCDNPPTDGRDRGPGRGRGRPTGSGGRSIDAVTVVLVGIEGSLSRELEAEEGFDVRVVDSLDAVEAGRGVDAVVIEIDGGAPLEMLGALRTRTPQAAVIVVTDPDREANGAVALHAGAEDHLVRGSIPEGFFPRAVRYAISQRRLRRDLATVDEITGLPNLRGFAPIAEHHLRLADRVRTPVVFLFVRLDGLEPGGSGSEEALREAAGVLLEAVRDSDVAARIGDDTFAVLLTGDAEGAENLVLSRLVEAIATHDAVGANPRSMSLAVGSALYQPDEPATLSQILETAGRRLHAPREPDPSETP